MEFFKELVELNNKIELNKLAREIYPIDSDDDDEEIQFTEDIRERFCKQYDKSNNRQFKLIKAHKINNR